MNNESSDDQQIWVGAFMTAVDRAMWGIPAGDIEKMAKAIATVRDHGGRLFIIGNGGGAGHASHAACDFRKLCHVDAYAVTDNASWLSAECNDDGYESAYQKWLQSHNFRGPDGLLVISVGGGSVVPPVSVNIVRAVRFATTEGCWVGGIVGTPGGYTAEHAIDVIRIAVDERQFLTPVVEGLQAVIWHALVSHPYLAEEIPKWESLQSI